MPTAGEQIGETIVKLTQENANLSREVERLQAYAKDTERAALKLKATLEAEIARLQSIVDALPKTADGVTMVPGMTIWTDYDRGREVTGFEVRNGILTCVEYTDGFDKCCGRYYSTCEAAQEARDA